MMYSKKSSGLGAALKNHLCNHDGDHHIEKMLWIVIAFVVSSILLLTISGAFSGQVATWYNDTMDSWFNVSNGMYLGDNGQGGTGTDNPTNVVPEGGIYYVGVTSTDVGDYTGATDIYYPGDTLPATVSYGDVYVYGDYEYRYNQIWLYSWEPAQPRTRLMQSTFPEGWGVRVLDDTKSGYGSILSSINGEPVTNAVATFLECFWLTSGPEIPDSIVCMYCTFVSCESLTSVCPVPAGVTNLSCAFAGCYQLTGSIEINSQYLDMYYDCLCDTQITEILGDCPDSFKEAILSDK